MTRTGQTQKQLLQENAELRRRLEEAEEALRAIREGEVDAVIVSGSQGDRVFSLTETENLHRLMVETMNEAGLATTLDGVVVYANDRACQLLSVTPQQILGHSIFEFVTNPVTEVVRALYKRAPTGRAMGRVQFRVANGAAVSMHVSASLLPHPDNPLVCIVGTDLSDIEADRELIQQLQQQREALQASEAQLKAMVNTIARQAEELRRSNVDLEQFAYATSHDLQEPLRMVSSFVQLLAQRYRGQLDAEADEFIAFAVDGAKRMMVLINDLLSYSRVGTRGQPFAPIDCEAVLYRVLTNLQFAIEDNRATVTHDPLPVVQADETHLIQLFQNLISNSLKFHSAAPPAIHVSATRGDGDWVFSIRDNGLGIEPQYFDRIFVIFQRLHGRQDFPGTGIGLAICKRIVERHGGRIWVESQPGHGATFYFTLPVVRP